MRNRPLRLSGRRIVITKNVIENAQENTLSAVEASRWIGVSYNTYKKWAKYYGIFEQHLNPAGRGVKKVWSTYKIPLEDILTLKRKSNYSLKILKKRLILEGYMQEECSVCAWNEKRVTDGKICIRLDFIDDDSENTILENMRLLCPNCYLSFNGFFHSSNYYCK